MLSIVIPSSRQLVVMSDDIFCRESKICNEKIHDSNDRPVNNHVLFGNTRLSKLSRMQQLRPPKRSNKIIPNKRIATRPLMVFFGLLQATSWMITPSSPVLPVRNQPPNLPKLPDMGVKYVTSLAFTQVE